MTSLKKRLEIFKNINDHYDLKVFSVLIEKQLLSNDFVSCLFLSESKNIIMFSMQIMLTLECSLLFISQHFDSQFYIEFPPAPKTSLSLSLKMRI